MELWKEILSIIVSNGVFAILFVWLFYYQLRDSAKREAKYQQTIEKLTSNLRVLENVRQDISDIKEFLKEENQYEETL